MEIDFLLFRAHDKYRTYVDVSCLLNIVLCLLVFYVFFCARCERKNCWDSIMFFSRKLNLKSSIKKF